MRLIDANEMLKRIESWNTSDAMDKALYNFTLNRIVEQSTVDAVPAIRCKDCKHNKNNKWVDCHITEFFGRTLDNYCSMAERKGEDATD